MPLNWYLRIPGTIWTRSGEFKLLMTYIELDIKLNLLYNWITVDVEFDIQAVSFYLLIRYVSVNALDKFVDFWDLLGYIMTLKIVSFK